MSLFYHPSGTEFSQLYRPIGSGGSWHDLLIPIFDVPGPSLTQDHDAFDIWAGQGAALSLSRHGPLELVREAPPISRRTFDQIGFHLVLSGSADIMTREQVSRALPGNVAIFNLQKPFRLRHETDAAAITLWLSPTGLEPSQVEPAHGLVLSGTPATAVFAAVLQTAVQEATKLGPSALGNIRGGISRLAADLLAPVLHASPAPAPELESFSTICDYIEANLNARNLSPTMLARTFGLSRASLYRLFEPVGGVASYIRSRRLERVRGTITARKLMNRRIAPVAYGNGFKSIASFNRAYRQAFGETPRQSRRGAAGGDFNIVSDERLGPLARALLEIG